MPLRTLSTDQGGGKRRAVTLNCSSATPRHEETPQVTLKLGSKMPLMTLEQPKSPLEQVERVIRGW
jgi:hypothetical protein